MKDRVEFRVSWVTLGKIALAVLLAFVLVRLWPLLELLLLALLIAITLQPIVESAAARNWPRSLGVFFCGLILFGFVALLVAILAPTFSTQGGSFIESLPALRQQWLAKLPASGLIRELADQLLSSPAFSDPKPILERFVAFLSVALSGVTEFFIVLIIALYFVADGPRVYNWLSAFLVPAQRQKMAIASQEIRSVVAHYMVGQLITSVLCGTYAFLVLMILRVPNAGFLAIMAAIFDVLPLIAFFLFSIPAVAVAFSVSGTTALIVAICYAAYHVAENYFIVPKVYGNRLRLSTLTVLVACLAAAMLSGVVGVILVLPLVASYPVVERLWLRPYLAPDTVQKHTAIDANETA
jgi:predicted PurR-regulated permease PerM